jgi:hypothetical protein
MEIRASNVDNCLEVQQKEKITDKVTLDRLTQNTIYFTEVTNYESLLFDVGDSSYYPDANIFQDSYFYDLDRVGIKYLAIVIRDDEERTMYQEYLNSSTQRTGENSDLQIEIFSDIETAKDWISQHKKKIQLYC